MDLRHGSAKDFRNALGAHLHTSTEYGVNIRRVSKGFDHVMITAKR